MRIPPHQAQRVMLLHDDLKEKAPKTYRDLKKEGQLWDLLEDRERQMMFAWSQTQEVVEKWKRGNSHLEDRGRDWSSCRNTASCSAG